METLGRYSVLEDQSETHAQPEERAWRTWRKAFNHDLRCYAALAVIPKAAFPSGQARQQFEDEVLTATGVHHRNVASIFRSGNQRQLPLCNGVLRRRNTRSASNAQWLPRNIRSAGHCKTGRCWFGSYEIGRDSLLIGAGAAVIFNDRVSVYAYYDGELARTNYSSNNVSAGVRVSF